MILGLGFLYLSIGTAAVPAKAWPVKAVREHAAASDTFPTTSLRGLIQRADSALAQDTVRRRRPRSVEVSDWYARRLTIHRYVSYSVLPVFAFQYAAGTQL